MAPRKAAAVSSAVAGERQGSTLKLIVDKGPAMGTTREFKPGVTVHIGRLVRGNTLAVKDAGISSKHLLFQADVESGSDGGRWTVTDLDSSNGTILNGAKLRPQEPSVLSDGDVIKIGEETAIRVEMVSVAANEVSVGVRRSTRRRAKEQVADLVAIDEDAELGLSSGDEGKIEVEVKQGRNANTRAIRSSAKNGKSEKDLNAGEDKDMGHSEIKGSIGVSTRRTRSSRKEANVDEVDLSVIEGKRTTMTTRGGRGRKKLPVETISEELVSEEPEPELKVEKEIAEVQVDQPAVEVKNSVTEDVATGATSSSAEVQEPNVKSAKVKIVADLENMTLGEWLDYVEEYEIQQIIDETEELLSEMTQKAERCHEYMLEQTKEQRS